MKTIEELQARIEELEALLRRAYERRNADLREQREYYNDRMVQLQAHNSLLLERLSQTVGAFVPERIVVEVPAGTLSE